MCLKIIYQTVRACVSVCVYVCVCVCVCDIMQRDGIAVLKFP